MNVFITNLIERIVCLIFILGISILLKDYTVKQFFSEMSIALIVALAGVISATILGSIISKRAKQKNVELGKSNIEEQKEKPIFKFEFSAFYLITIVVAILIAFGLITVQTYATLIIVFEIVFFVVLLVATISSLKTINNTKE